MDFRLIMEKSDPCYVRVHHCPKTHKVAQCKTRLLLQNKNKVAHTNQHKVALPT